ncbi:MAG: polysaccharide deacetylase family protein [Evtepia gabavorous]
MVYNIWIYASQVQRMVAEGHQVANHTYNHPDLVQSSDALVRQEVDSLAQALTQITGLKGTGNTSFYLRPPFGSRNQRVLSLAGTPVVCWSVDSSDWKIPGRQPFGQLRLLPDQGRGHHPGP